MAWALISDLRKPDHPQAQIALNISTQVLTALTGHLYQETHTVTEMYDTRQTLAAGAQLYAATKAGLLVGQIRPGCECNSCGVTHRIRLRSRPVTSIIDVHIAGRRLNPNEYMLLDHAVVGFLTSDVCCAGCVVVRYRYGGNIPAAGKFAACKLADELVESLDPGGDCKLPQRVTSISRQGVSWTLLDPQDFLDSGRTGIYEVDLFLTAFNPARAIRPARVFSVDRPRVSTMVQEYPAIADVLLPDDMVVIPGAPSGWLVTDRHAVDVLTRDNINPRVIIDGIGEIRPEFEIIPSGILFTIPARVTAEICWGTCWSLVAHNELRPHDEVLLTGEARTL
jgi:hypothetical protein